MSPSGALLARNARNQAYPGRVAFLAWSTTPQSRGPAPGPSSSAATVRLPNLRRSWPAGALSNRVGAGLDPCGALRHARCARSAGETREIVILLGDAPSADAADALAVKYRAADLDAVLAPLPDHWDDILGAIAVVTPDRRMDVMLNGWLLYQTLACRMWARSGFYQASGAYGFRDQLQDCLALAVAAPDLAREPHPAGRGAPVSSRATCSIGGCRPAGKGVRTRIADDAVWLAYAAAEYLKTTGDTAILDEHARLSRRAAPRRQRARRVLRAASERGARCRSTRTCVDALERRLAVGRSRPAAHGQPATGTTA